jgi:HD-GYP domain-containing protein (c-di-GMP phosphodiesterase class II)
VHSPVTVFYVSVVGVLALALVWLGVKVAGTPEDVLALGVLSALAIASWLLREPDVGSRIPLSFLSIILLAAAVITGPVGAAVVGAVATLIQFKPEPVIVRVFNVALFSAMGSVGGLVYLWVGGANDISSLMKPAPVLLRVGLPMMIADVIQCLLNAALIALVLRITTGTPFRTQIAKLLGTTGMAYIGYGIIGFLFVVLWIPARVGWFSAVLVLAPLFVARWAFAQYGDELRAHERTLRALVTAVEIKEPHNQGHSERVARLSEWLAESLGLGHKEIQDIRTAGMLHDIGKVSVPTRLLLGRRKLTDDELVLLADHARAGVELVDDIDFVAGSLDGIAHHHERYDGRGYPAGLAGDGIPLAARVVAVADAFDALTSRRSYRVAHGVQDAVRLVGERAGTHLDPDVVEALERVVARHGWQPTVGSDELVASSGVATDHDDPEMSDFFAERSDLRDRLRAFVDGPEGQGQPVPHDDTHGRPASHPDEQAGHGHRHVGGRV